jgi:ABC-2 type transport system ATP-binding protein
VLSSHLLGDLERVCDHLIVLASSRVQLAGDVDELLAVHYRLNGARGDFDELPAGVEVIQAEHTTRQSSLVVHSTDPIAGAQRIDLEDLVLAYMTRAANESVSGLSAKPLEVQR